MMARLKALSVIQTCAVALFSLALVNCGGTFTRSVNRQDPNALTSTMKNLKAQEVEILLRDGGKYLGKIAVASKDTVDIETPRAHSKIPMARILSVSYKDHGLGATHGLYSGFLWVGGIVTGIGIISGGASEEKFLPSALAFSAIFGGLSGLLIGAATGATVTYEFRDTGRSVDTTKHSNTAGSVDTTQLSDTVKTRQDDTTAKLAKGSPPPEDEYVMPDQLGRVQIILKDGAAKSSSVIREIHETWIVYEKDGILHDLTIEKILRVEFSRDGMNRTAVFDKNRIRIVPKEKVEAWRGGAIDYLH